MSALLASSLPEFFQEKVNRAIHDLKVPVSPHAEYYLVNLLTSFTHSEKLFDRDEKGEIVDRALALRLFDAMMESPTKRIPILKKMGDVALYTSGFFGDSLCGKMVDIGYYIRMGYTAYSSVSQLITDQTGKTLKELFDELAGNFTGLVNVLSDVADSSNLKTDQDLLRLYEKWLATGSDRVHALLCKEGITPNALIKTKYPQ